jgi:hypothetical protein
MHFFFSPWVVCFPWKMELKKFLCSVSLKLLTVIIINCWRYGCCERCLQEQRSAADRYRNYLDRMSIAARQQQRDRDHEQHTEARARLTDQERQ